MSGFCPHRLHFDCQKELDLSEQFGNMYHFPELCNSFKGQTLSIQSPELWCSANEPGLSP